MLTKVDKINKIIYSIINVAYLSWEYQIKN